MASCIGVGAVVGFWADKSLGTSPCFSVIGTLIGVAASVLGMFKMLLSVLKSTK